MITIKRFIFTFIAVAAILFLSPFSVHASDTGAAGSGVSQKSSLLVMKEQNRISMTANSKNAVINGGQTKLEAAAVVKYNQLFVPAKSISQILGAGYTWDAKSKTSSITKGTTRIVLSAGNKYAVINGKKVQGDSLYMEKAIPMVSARLIAEGLGAKYLYNAKSKTAAITTYSEALNFPDANLEKAVRSALKKKNGYLFLDEVKKLKALSIYNTRISTLDGLQFLSGLTVLGIINSNIEDISPIGSLSGLERLSLNDNMIKDISRLSSLKKLTYLDLSNNSVTDISPLKKLSDINSLMLDGNRITEIGALSALKKLSFIDISDNQISGVSPLKNLGNLKSIRLWNMNSLDKILRVDEKAAEIVRSVTKPGMSALDKELAIHDYIITHCKYDKENYYNDSIPIESHQPYGVLILGKGVCDGYAYSMQILLNKCGIESNVVLGQGNGPRGWEGHAWNAVKLGGSYFQLDATYDDPIANTGADMLSHTYFNLSDIQMGLDHKWDRKLYPECTVDSPYFSSSLIEERRSVITNDCYFSLVDDYLYKISLDGETSVKLCEDRASDIILDDGWIYFINLDDKNRIYKISPDGSNKTSLSYISSNYLSILGEWIYYLDSGHHLCRIAKAGTDQSIVNADAITSYIASVGDSLFFRCYMWNAGSRIYRLRTGSSGNSISYVVSDSLPGFELSSDGMHISFYLGKYEYIDDGWVYYINGSDEGRVYKVGIDGFDKKKISNEKAAGIELFNGWIYFSDKTDSSKYFKVRADGSEETFIGG